MSNSDSFIDEVTEELQRDRMFAVFRKYGWIAAALVVLVVGGVSFNEFRKAQNQATAQLAGDGLVQALESEEAAVRQIALDETVAAGGGGAVLARFLLASEQANADQIDEAVKTYETIASDTLLAAAYRDLAALKALGLQSTSLSASERETAYTALAGPGRPFRLLAEEQLGFLDVERGDTDRAISRFQTILNDTELSEGLRRRLTQAIVALGGALDAETGAQ